MRLSGTNGPDDDRQDLDGDADSPGAGTASRPVHLRPSLLALVAGGGAIGTAAREALSLAVPQVDGLAIVIVAINIAGAFLLGVLLEALMRGGPDAGGRRLLRLVVGTGFCGGFTTYSTLATTSAVLLTIGSVGPAALSALATVLIGGLASWSGVATGAALAPRRRA